MLRGNSLNQTYFRDHIDFSTLSKTLQAFRFTDGVRIVELCDSLLNIAVRNTWPPSCSKHLPPKQLPPWETSFFEYRQASPDILRQSSLAQSRALAGSCSVCKEGLHIENPEVFKLILQLLGTACQSLKNKTPPIVASLDSYINYYVLVVNTLTFLTDAVLSNQNQLSACGLISTVLEYFQDTLFETNM